MKTAITDRPWYLAGKKRADQVVADQLAVTLVKVTHVEVDEKRPSVWVRYWVHFDGGKHTGVFEATISRSRDKRAEKGGFWLQINRIVEVYQTSK